MRLLIAALLAALASPAAAQPAQGVLSVGLIPGWIRPDGARIAAIEILLAPGWHTYWRAPGLNGIPPQFDWSASENLAAVAYDWPRPEVFDSFGSPTIGYEGALVLPVLLTPRAAEAAIEAALDLSFGVCREICIPAEARLRARLAPGDAPQGRARIEAALASRPIEAGAAGVTAARCALEAAPAGHRLTAEITFAAPPGAGLTTVIEADRSDLWIGSAETRTVGRVVHASARLEGPGPDGYAIDRSGLRLTLLDAARAIDIRGCAGD